MKQRNIRGFVLLVCLCLLVWQSCKVGADSCEEGATEACTCPGSSLQGEWQCIAVSGITTWGPCKCDTTPGETTAEAQPEPQSDETSGPEPPAPRDAGPLDQPVSPDAGEASPGDKSSERTLEQPPEQTVEVTPEQPPAQVIELLVSLRTATGEPIPNATVLLGPFSAKTNSKGEFQRPVSTGRYPVTVLYEHRWNNNRNFFQVRWTLHKNRKIEPTTKQLRLTMPTEAKITGKVFGKGKGVPGATVSFTRNGPFVGSNDRLVVKVTVNSQGEFDFPVFVGEYNANASPPPKSSLGFLSSKKTIKTSVRIDFMLPALVPLQGLVVKSTGTALPNARVSFSNWSGTTSNTGAFSFFVLPGTHPFRITMEEKPTNRVHWRGIYETLIAYTAPSSRSHRLTTPQLSLLSVQVTGGGRALANVQVSVRCAPSCQLPFVSSTSQGSTGGRGAYRTPLANGSYEVTLTPALTSGFGPKKVSVSLSPGTTQQSISVKLPPRYKISGKITNAKGTKPTGTGHVRIGDSSSTLGPGGVYSVSIPAGAYDLVFNHLQSWSNGRNTHTAGLTLRKQLQISGPLTFDGKLPPMHTISGKITTGGKGYANVYIKGSCFPCQAPVTSARVRVYTNAAGEFSAQLYPGTYEFGIFPPNTSGFLSKTISKVKVEKNVVLNSNF